LCEEIARDLAHAISKGRLRPGNFLPAEQALAEKYQASRTAVREALMVLSTRGMVEVMHGRGTRVLPRHRWQLLDQLVRLVREDIDVDRSLFELRRILEVEVAGLAAERATAAQLRALREAIKRGWECVKRPEDWTVHDSTFHHLLAQASGNLLLPQVMESVSMLVRAAALSTARDPGATASAMEKHETILAKVEARDPAGAREAMRRHLVGVEKRFLEKLQAAGAKPKRREGV
jgi:GntR family transcriptional repressor for pyruvate dehydrogenase complex